MEIQFDSKRLTISGCSLLYDPYYFAVAAEGKETDWVSVVKDVLRQWADGLFWQASGEPLFLPFGIYDQCVEWLTAELAEETGALRCAWLNQEGWG